MCVRGKGGEGVVEGVFCCLHMSVCGWQLDHFAVDSMRRYHYGVALLGAKPNEVVVDREHRAGVLVALSELAHCDAIAALERPDPEHIRGGDGVAQDALSADGKGEAEEGGQAEERLDINAQCAGTGQRESTVANPG